MNVTLEKNHKDLTEDKWRNCPRMPNAVATNHPSPNRRMLPLNYQGVTMDTAREQLVRSILTIRGSEIGTVEDNYVHVRFRSAVFHLPHDGEFYFDDRKKQILYRARSLSGFADFGMNKRWLQSVCARFIKQIRPVQEGS
ncbi:DUF1499 domain-containing protein [Sporolactobacillus sp. THM7-4]|nr:DUF1499 domain-containing protein [Sporolactobacillus sp. THM7-4]